MSHYTTMTSRRSFASAGTPVIATPALVAGIEILLQALDRGAKQASRTVASLWVRYLTWQMRRTTRTALQALDSRSLQDIGIDSAQIEVFIRALKYRAARF
jgi:uncharacterized protein YjiS (DUF1127 family)